MAQAWGSSSPRAWVGLDLRCDDGRWVWGSLPTVLYWSDDEDAGERRDGRRTLSE